jgi:hypothetical protein
MCYGHSTQKSELCYFLASKLNIPAFCCAPLSFIEHTQRLIKTLQDGLCHRCVTPNVTRRAWAATCVLPLVQASHEPLELHSARNKYPAAHIEGNQLPPPL